MHIRAIIANFVIETKIARLIFNLQVVLRLQVELQFTADTSVNDE